MLLSFARQGIDTAPKSNQPLVEIRMFFSRLRIHLRDSLSLTRD
jgi:hypothetical protein